jgi:hypothetical protein
VRLVGCVIIAMDGSLFSEAAFSPEQTQVMGLAYERACLTLPGNGYASILKEIIARRIIEAAQRGELDPQRLYEEAVTGIP